MDTQPPSLDVLLAHSDWIRRLVRGLVGAEDRADDVVQQTFLQALGSPPRHGGNPRAWLAAVARNVIRRTGATDAQRRARERIAATAAASSAAAPAAEIVVEIETLRQVSSAVLRVREPYRTALLLRFYQDLAPREIASRLDAPLETIRSQIKRGLAQLREQLDRSHGGDRVVWTRALIAWAGLPPAGPATMITTLSVPAVAGPTLGGLLIMGKSATILGAAVLLISAAIVGWQVLARKEHVPAQDASRPVAAAPAEPRRSDGPAREPVARTEPIADAAAAPKLAATTPTTDAVLDPALAAIKDQLDAESYSHLAGWDEGPVFDGLIAALRDGLLDSETCARFLDARVGKAIVVPGTQESKGRAGATQVSAMLVYPTGTGTVAAAPCSAGYDAEGTLVRSFVLINIRESPVPGLTWNDSDVKLSIRSEREKDAVIHVSLWIEARGHGTSLPFAATEEQKLDAIRIMQERQHRIDQMYKDGLFGRPFEILLAGDTAEARFTSYDGGDRTTVGSQPVGAETAATFRRLFARMGELLPASGR